MRTARNTLPRVASTITEITDIRFARSPRGRTLLPGSTKAMPMLMGMSRSPVMITALFCMMTPESMPMYRTVFFGNRLWMIALSCSDTGSIPLPMRPPQCGRMNITAATLIASSRILFTS